MKAAQKTRVIIFNNWFVPGFKAGGPITSIRNFSLYLENNLDIFILTSNKDLHESNSYLEIIPNTWYIYSKNVKVYYIQSRFFLMDIKLIIGDINPSIIYFNSIWSLGFTIIPLFLTLKDNKIKKIVSPRGMLNSSAMKINSLKKCISINLMKYFAFFDNVIFVGSNKTEVLSIKKYFNKNKVVEIGNFPSQIDTEFKDVFKKKYKLKLTYISRINKVKNLMFVCKCLKLVDKKIDVKLSVYGPIEDRVYFQQCLNEVKYFTNNVKFKYFGLVRNEEVKSILHDNHFFILPTLGENFGHAIFESFAAGRPVIISDQTPWRNLKEQKVGFDISLNGISDFVSAIEFAASMEQDEFDKWCESSLDYANKYNEKSNLKQKYLELFN